MIKERPDERGKKNMVLRRGESRERRKGGRAGRVKGVRAGGVLLNEWQGRGLVDDYRLKREKRPIPLEKGEKGPKIFIMRWRVGKGETQTSRKLPG